MSKVEDLARKYCEGSTFSDACMEKPAYIAGYHQAEKDLELTWEDIDWIVGETVCRVSEDSTAEQICKEVLKRFKKE